MKYYRVWPKYKKTLVESEMYKDDDGNLVWTHVTWRTGEFKVGFPETVEEWAEYGFDEEDIECRPSLEDYAEEDCELEDFPEVEMLSCYDGCEENIEYKFREGFEDRQTLLEEFVEDEGSTALWEYDRGYEFHPCDGWYVIYDGIEFEEWEDED